METAATSPWAPGFGLAGLFWQRLPARLHRSMPVVALLAGAAGLAGEGLWMRGGSPVSVWQEAVFLLTGFAGGCSYSPLFSRALGRVDPAQAADASGVLITVLQLAQVVGVASVGTVFLSSVSFPAAPAASGHALATASAVVGALMLGAAVFAHRTRSAAAPK